MRILILFLAPLLPLSGIAAAAAHALHETAPVEGTPGISGGSSDTGGDHGHFPGVPCSCSFCTGTVLSTPPSAAAPETARIIFTGTAQPRHVPPYPALIEYPPERG